MRSYILVLLYVLGLSLGAISRASAQNLPEDTVYVDRAVLAYSERRFDDALAELNEALRVNSNSYEALYYQGLIYQELNRTDEARQALEKAHELRPQSVDISFQLGVLYLKRQDIEKAEPLLRQAYRADPQRPNLGYYLGLVDYRKKNYRSALEFFRTANPSDEEFAQLARFYAGLAASALGFPRIAQGEINEAMRIRPDSPVSNPIPRFSGLLEEEARQEKFFHAEIRFGFVYDTAASLILDPALKVFSVPDSDHQSGATTSVVAVPPVKRGSTGELASLDLSYTWLKTLNWDGMVGYRFAHVEENQAADFSSDTHNLSFSLNRKGLVASLPYYAGLQWIYDHISLGHKSALERWTVNPYFTLVENPNNVTNLLFRVQVKNFYQDPIVSAEVRDAVNYAAGPTHYFLFDNGRHFVKFGYQHDRENAEGSNWAYNGNRLLFGVQYTLPWEDIRLRYDFDHHWRSYRHPNTLLPEAEPNTKKRNDRDGIHAMSISKDFTIGTQKFNATFDYLFDNVHSNLSAFSFNRHVVIPSVAWLF